MTQQSDPIRDGFIYHVGELAGSLGLSRSVGQLYALLYMSPRALCLDEMVEACQMSKGNASINVRELERWGAVRRVWVRGDRKDYYEANRSVPQIVMGRLKDGLGRRLGLLEGAVAEAGERVEQMEGDARTREFYKARLGEIQEIHRSLRRVLNNLDRIYELGKRFL